MKISENKTSTLSFGKAVPKLDPVIDAINIKPLLREINGGDVDTFTKTGQKIKRALPDGEVVEPTKKTKEITNCGNATEAAYCGPDWLN